MNKRIYGLIAVSVAFLATLFFIGGSLLSGDSGPADQVAMLKVRSVELMEAEMSLGNISPAAQKVIGESPSSTGGQRLHQQLAEIWVPSEAESSFDQIVSLFVSENGMAIDQTFDQGHLVVTSWRGVKISGDRATAKFSSYFEQTKNHRTSRDAETLWTLTLERQPTTDVWLIASREGECIGSCG